MTEPLQAALSPDDSGVPEYAQRFYPWSRSLYGLSESNYRDYLDDVAVQELDDVAYGGERPRLNNKWYMEEVLADFLPQTLAYFDGAYLLWGAENGISQPCVLKPTNGTQGDGVAICPNGLTVEEIDGIRSQHYEFIIQQYVQQHSYAEKIWPHCLNTMRLHMIHDDEPYMVAAVHKWGTLHSGHLDNFSQGGVTTQILLDDGMLWWTREDRTKLSERYGWDPEVKGSARMPRFPESDRLAVHPESKAVIFGQRIPFWDETVTLANNVMWRVSDEITYAGLDVAVTENGPVLIEINAWPGVHLLQMHGGLLRDERYKNYVKQVLGDRYVQC